MNKVCVCGKTIPIKNDLCRECLSLYGTDKTEWAEWLRFMVSDLKREYEYEIKHSRDLEFDDERDSLSDNVEFEDVLWDD